MDHSICEGNVGGYTRVGVEKGDKAYGGGFSIYSAAWPLLQEYPGQCYQTGLFGTWMFGRCDRPAPFKLYSDIEGGLGWWRDTEFATETPKFIMGGVALNFCAWANGPGAGKGRDWEKPQGKYGVAQLSPNVLWPPDGVNLKRGACGELFGYGYLPLPLADAKTTTAGKDVATGDQCWTLFFNTANFKGPVAFFTPYFWSKPTVEDPQLEGMFLDACPSQPNRSMSMETQHIPWVQATDSNGQMYGRMAPTTFPIGPDGKSAVVHGITSYSREAMWDGVKAWFDGGDPVDGAIDLKTAYQHDFNGEGGAGWHIWVGDMPREERPELVTEDHMQASVPDPSTFGFEWSDGLVESTGGNGAKLVTLPEYYRLVETEEGARDKWVAVPAEDVPAETGLADVSFAPEERTGVPYVTPEEPDSCWKTPGPVAGPFEARPGDGSVVTYYWYRFADQPALLNADLTDQEREDMQKRVELLHRNWTKDREYLPPPKIGELAEIDPALIVTPPEGLEVGYVPIVTRQEAETCPE